MKKMLVRFLYRYKALPKITKGNRQILVYGNELIKNSLINEELPKIVWIYWDSEKLPSLINKAIENLKKQNPNFVIKVLNNRNIINYISSDLYNLKDKVYVKHYSDLLRLYLLYNYGGIWLDASVLWFRPIQSFLLEIDFNEDIFLTYNPQYTINPNQPIFENWLIISKPHVYFIKKWYELTLDYLTNYTETEFLKLDNLKFMAQNISEDMYTYLRQHIACQKLLLQGDFPEVKINTYSTRNEGLSYSYYPITNKLDDYYYFKIICICYSKNEMPYFLKLNGNVRIYMEKFESSINSKSLIGRFLESKYFDIQEGIH